MAAWERPTVTKDVYQVTVFTKLFNQILMNTFFWRIDSAVEGTYVKDVYQYLHDQLNDGDGLLDTMARCMNNAANIYQLRIQRIQSTLTPNRLTGQVFDVDWDGGGGVDQACNSDAVIVRESDIAGRAEVGRVHINIPVTVDNCANGVILNALKVKLNDVAANIFHSYEVVGSFKLIPIIYHRGVVPQWWSDLAEVFVEDTVRVMCRRTVGRGI